jgi:DNA-binding transcriptional ArsR family regulator
MTLTTAAFAETAALMGDPARAAMLQALMDGRALTAGELARSAGITPQTASAHLARLTEAGLLAMEKQGRHRYHRLAGPAVAQMLEGVMAFAATARPASRLATGPRDAAMRDARTCYDHLAGRLGVAIADSLVARGLLELTPEAGALTGAGTDFLRRLGVALPARRGRLLCRPCLDWSERRPHLAGALGAALCSHCLAQGWIRREAGSRTVRITRAGEAGLRAAFGIGA